MIMKRLIIQLSALLLVLLVAGCTSPESEETAVDREFEPRDLNTEYESIRLTQVVSGLEYPWAIAFLPDNRMLVTERPGRLNVIENGEIREISGVPEVQAQNQGGMLDVSVHPNYEDNGWIYLTYSKPNDGTDTATAVARAQLDGYSLTNLEEIFVQDRYSSPGRHYGSRIAWTNDGKMLVSIGDRGADPPRAQDLGDHAGKLLRLNDDGSVPEDNPYIGQDGVHPEIFSYGHRNIQGLIVDPRNGDIWGTEHGPRGGDELNYIEATNNYGWPSASLGRSYGDEQQFHDGTEARQIEGMVDPIYELLPTHAPSGLALVTANQFPNWEGDLLAGGLRGERIRRLVIEDYVVIHEEEILHSEIGRIRDVREGPDGYIYIATDHSDGGIYRIEPRD
jgi:aldose sugar dehydrogenase